MTAGSKSTVGWAVRLKSPRPWESPTLDPPNTRPKRHLEVQRLHLKTFGHWTAQNTKEGSEAAHRTWRYGSTFSLLCSTHEAAWQDWGGWRHMSCSVTSFTRLPLAQETAGWRWQRLNRIDLAYWKSKTLLIEVLNNINGTMSPIKREKVGNLNYRNTVLSVGDWRKTVELNWIELSWIFI